MSNSEFVGKEPCPKCGSADNLARYSDGHAHCFSHGCDYWEPSEGEVKTQTKRAAAKTGLITDIEFSAIQARGLSEETCRKWGYGIGTAGGKTVQVAQYRDPTTNEIVGQKLRTKDKDFAVRGSIKGQLYGRHLWRDTGKRVIITEGEIDAMTVSQVLDHRWQVVSIPNGINSAQATLAANLDWLNGFDEIVLCFDMDEVGRAAIPECAALFAPGKVKYVVLPEGFKDPSDMLQAKRAGDLVSALWNAKEHRPDGIVRVRDVKAAALRPPTMGLPWCLPELTIATWGRHYGELVGLGAGTGVGKTTLIVQQITEDLAAGHKVGAFLFEQPPPETLQLVAGMRVGKQFTTPDGSWTPEELEAELDKLDEEDNLFLYDHFGANDWQIVRSSIRYLYHAHGVRIFYLDHLTALAAGSASEVSGALEVIMRELGSLVKEIPIWLLFVSHLNTPDGKTHEEGGRVTIANFKGSRSIGFWAHFLFGLERNQQSADDDERSLTHLRVLKARPPRAARSTGRTYPLHYDFDTGRLVEGAPGESATFKDETEDQF